MISQERLIQILPQTFKGETTEQIRQAEEELILQYQFPEFPSLLCHMIETTFSGNPSLCEASVFQLKGYLMANHQFLAENGINLLIQLTLILPPNLLQILEIITHIICEFDVKNDIGLIQAFEPLLTSNSPIAGFILLDSYFKSHNSSSQENIGNIQHIINAEFQMVQQVLGNSPNDPKVPLYLHYFSTSCVSYLIDYAPQPEQINPFYLFANQIFKTYSATIFDIPSDYLDVILNCIILLEDPNISYENLFDPNIFLSSCESYFQHSPSSLGLTQFYQIMKIFLKNEKTFSELLQNLPQMIGSFFFPVFQISEGDQFNFETDPKQFLDDIFPSIQEEETPRSSAASCLYQSSESNREIIPKIVFSYIIQMLNSGAQFQPWDIFSAVLFFSTCSQFYSEGCTEFDQFIEQVISSNLQSGNPILLSSSLIFLANFPTNFGSTLSCKHPFIHASIYTLSTSSSHPIIRYLSCCACGHLLKLIKEQESFDSASSLEIAPEILTESLQNLFLTSHQYPTERMAQSVSNFIDFFTTSNDQMLGQFTEQAITTMMQLLVQYMQDDTEEAHQSVSIFSNAIQSLCTKINIQNLSLFDSILEQVDNMIEDQYQDNYLEDILPLINGCVIGSGTTLTEQIASIPQKLRLLMEGDGTAEALQISQIYKSYTLKFFKSDNFELISIVNPIIEMIPQLIEEAEMYQGDELIALMNFAQLLFVFIPNFIPLKDIGCEIDFEQCIGEWIQSIASMDSCYAADCLAAFIQFAPVAAFNNTELPVFDNWITNSRPKAFLASASSVLTNFSLLLNVFNEEMKNRILEKALNAKLFLNSDEYDNDENNEFFNMDSILAFFSEKA